MASQLRRTTARAGAPRRRAGAAARLWLVPLGLASGCLDFDQFGARDAGSTVDHAPLVLDLGNSGAGGDGAGPDDLAAEERPATDLAGADLAASDLARAPDAGAPPRDAAPNDAIDAALDLAGDGSADAALDGAPDAAPDAGPDAAPDGPVEHPADGAADAAPGDAGGSRDTGVPPDLVGVAPFVAGKPVTVGCPIAGVVSASLNGMVDNLTDIALSCSVLPNDPQKFGGPAIYLGDGKGNLAFGGYAHSGALTVGAIAAADFDGDGGRIDLLTISEMGSSASFLRGRGDGGFDDGVVVAAEVPGAPHNLAVGDFDDDGVADAVVGLGSDLGPNTLWIYSPKSGKTLSNTVIPGAPRSIYTVQLNPKMDQKIDLVVALGAGVIGFGGMLRGAPAGMLGKLNLLPVANAILGSVAAGAFVNGQNPDLIGLYASALGMIPFRFYATGNGDGSFGAPVGTPTGGSSLPKGVVVVDFNNDNALDYALLHQGAVQIVLGNGKGLFQPPLTVGVSQATAMVAAELNGDGKPDLVVVSSINNSIYLLLNNFN